MKILWLSHFVPYPPKAGVLQRGYYLLREFARRHEVDLIAFNQSALLKPLCLTTEEEGLREAKKELLNFCKSVSFLPIPIDSIPLGKYWLAIKSFFSITPYTINWLRSKEMEKALAAKLAYNQYDLVHFDTISLDVFKKYVKGIPTVLDHHNIESHMMLRRAKVETNFIKKWYFLQEGRRLASYEKQHCTTYTGHITCSQVDLDRLQASVSGINGTVVPNGVDMSFFKPQGVKTKGKKLIFIGTMNWYPNIEAVRFIAHEIMPLLRREKLNIEVQIIGASPPGDLVRYSQKYLDFKVLGFVDEIRTYMEEAAIYVCPINDGGGTKLKILDALAMGKVIVAHPVACEGIEVTDQKNVVFAETAQQYVTEIKSLLDDPVRCVQIGVAARHLAVSKYDYKQIGQKMSIYYESLVN